MEDMNKFYESNLIPFFRAKHSDMSLRIIELEAFTLFQDEKIKKLEEKIKQMENGQFLSNQDTAASAVNSNKKNRKQKHWV